MFSKLKLISNIFLPFFYFTLFIFFSLIPNIVKAEKISAQQTNSKIYKKLENIPAEAQQVKVGFYTQNIYELDPENNTYHMDFYVWFNWKGDINPTEKVEFMNGVEE